METDADRLASIKALGGQCVSHQAGSFFGIYDRDFLLSVDGVTETRQPAITARSSDVDAIPKDTVLSVGGEVFRIKRPEPDGTGMTVLILKR